MPILDHMAHRRAALHREAQHWLLRLTSGNATMHDATAFEHWCGQSPAHVEAFAETRRLWENLGPAADAWMAEEQARTTAQLPRAAALPRTQPRMSRRAFLGAAIAASAALVVLHPPLQLWPSLTDMVADYRTATGEQREVDLGHGVVVQMNTQTAINLRTSSDQAVGIELLGAAGAAADAEVLHLACTGLESLGISRYRLVVGHLGATLQLLAAMGMSDHAQGLVLDQMDPIARGRVGLDAAVARVADLLGGGGASTNGADAGLPPTLANLPPEQATAIAADILGRASLPVEGGARQPRDIIQRLLAKAQRPDPTEQVRNAFEFVAQLHAAAGPPERLEHELRPLLQQRGLSTAPIDEVAAALDLLRAHGSSSGEAVVEVDLSLARGLRYYTGLVFEIYVDDDQGALQVCGGGRYDDLVRALGGRETVPACGFSFGLERVDLARGAQQPDRAPRADHTPRALVVGVTAEDHRQAVDVARQLRAINGLVVEQDVRVRGVKAALRYADRAGIGVVVIVGEREREAGVVLLRDMRTREERQVAASELTDAVKQALA